MPSDIVINNNYSNRVDVLGRKYVCFWPFSEVILNESELGQKHVYAGKQLIVIIVISLAIHDRVGICYIRYMHAFIVLPEKGFSAAIYKK